jgi:hypothetical protein
MGVKPTGMEGHVLTEALEHPLSADQQTRAAEVKQLSPIVNTLSSADKAGQS